MVILFCFFLVTFSVRLWQQQHHPILASSYSERPSVESYNCGMTYAEVCFNFCCEECYISDTLQSLTIGQETSYSFIQNVVATTNIYTYTTTFYTSFRMLKSAMSIF